VLILEIMRNPRCCGLPKT